MADKNYSKTKMALRGLELLLAIGLLLAIIELVLIQRSSHVLRPQVKLVERTEETLVVKLPPGATTNANALKSPAASQPATRPPNQPETVTITRTVPPLLAFENLRRFLGLLGPAKPETVMAYRRNETEHTINIPGNSSQAKQQALVPPTNTLGAGTIITPPDTTAPPSADRAKPAIGDPFRISLPQ